MADTAVIKASQSYQATNRNQTPTSMQYPDTGAYGSGNDLVYFTCLQFDLSAYKNKNILSAELYFRVYDMLNTTVTLNAGIGVADALSYNAIVSAAQSPAVTEPVKNTRVHSGISLASNLSKLQGKDTVYIGIGPPDFNYSVQTRKTLYGVQSTQDYIPTLTITYEDAYTIRYGKNGSWVNGEVKAPVSGAWQRCKVYYGKNGAWVECNTL